MPAPPPLRCLRCKTTELVPLDSPAEVSFFECPACHREYTARKEGDLTFRWGHPITLLLYPVIFDPDPLGRCESVAADFVLGRDPKTVRKAIQEIRLELDDPTQQVRDTVDCWAAESALRVYLRCVANRIEACIGDVPVEGDPVLDSFHIDTEAIWSVLRMFRTATGEQRTGAARYLGLAATPYFRKHRQDPELVVALERALQDAANDPDPETAFAGRAGLNALRT
jgi:hypothetical protein